MKDLREQLVKKLDRDTKQKEGCIQGVTVLRLIDCFVKWANSSCENSRHFVNQGTAKRDCPYCWDDLARMK